MDSKQKVKIIPLGGHSEVGKNMLVVECGEDIIVLDAGLMFPEEEMLGIDLVIPDISYLMENKEKVRGIIITHGHEDHIGALPYVLPQLNVPIYCTKLTAGLISVKLRERHNVDADIRVIPTDGAFGLGCFRIEFFPVCHSIPDSVGLAIRTPVGVIVHTSDFKLDYTPVGCQPTDLTKLAQLGAQGVLALLSDSTYAELPGYTPSERVVGEAIDHIVAEAPGRVIIATFSSLVSRIQQIIDVAAKHNRRVFIIGHSMSETVRMARELGYLNAPEGSIARVDELQRTRPEEVVIVTTGTQGEPTSALVRMANQDHRQLKVIEGDTVVISATPIPGNEASIDRTINALFKQGATVLYDKIARVHVHGHASQEELKLILNLTKPKFFVPIHGEYRHLSLHGKLAESVGVPRKNIFLLEDGDVLELSEDGGEKAGKVSASHVYVDGLSVGDVDSVILRDRKTLSKEGIVMVVIPVDSQTGRIVGRPDIVSRGFVDVEESKEMIEASKDLVVQEVDRGSEQTPDWGYVSTKVKDTLFRFYYEKTRRRPMILPFMVSV